MISQIYCPQKMAKMTRHVWSSCFLVLALLASTSLAEEDFSSTSSSTTTATTTLRPDDKLLLVFVFLSFAFSICMFASFLAYISFQEDRIMNEYMEEGLTVLGDVVSIEFTRGSGGGGGGGDGGGGQRRGRDKGGQGKDPADNVTLWNRSTQKEYCVSVEYAFVLSDNYPIRVRKTLKVLEGDFVYPDHPERNQPVQAIQIKTSKNPKQDNDGLGSMSCSSYNCAHDIHIDLATIADMTDCPEMPTIGGGGGVGVVGDGCGVVGGPVELIVRRDSFFKNHFQLDQRRKLEICILPQLQLSGLPLRQVQRRQSARYRCFSISFVGASLLIALFCFYLAIKLLLVHYEMGEDYFTSARAVGWIMLATFVTLSVLQIPFIHVFLHQTIRRSLEEEYFELGEVVKGGMDDSTLSSGNDSFFAYNKFAKT